MTTSQFDAKTGSMFTTEITDFSHSNRIIGEGYFVIINPDSKHVSFSKAKHDICLGDIVSDIIPNYTNQQYANDYGDRLTGMGLTVREFMQKNCRMNIL
jgi:hypothetical protein